MTSLLSSTRSICGNRKAFCSSAQRGQARQHSSCHATVASSEAGAQPVQLPELGRRTALLSIAAATLGLSASGAAPSAALAKDAARVGEYLPKADIDGFNQFVPDRSKTPVGVTSFGRHRW